MTSSVLDVPPARLGDQHPRICSVPEPPALSSAGTEAVELAASAGLDLDPWQAFILDRRDASRVEVSIHPPFTALRSVQTVLEAGPVYMHV